MADYDMDTHSMIADTTILPAQYFDRARKLGPEASLWFATLTDAIRTVQHEKISNPRSLKIYVDALEWLYHDDVRPGSFAFICEIFDLDPDSIRRALATANPVPRNRPTGMTANRVSTSVYQVHKADQF